MFKRLSTVLLIGATVGLAPAAAFAAPAAPQPARAFELNDHRDDDHYRCMYRCDERYRRGRHRHRHDHHHYDRHRHRRYCWYRGDDRWYKAPCGRPHGHHHHH